MFTWQISLQGKPQWFFEQPARLPELLKGLTEYLVASRGEVVAVLQPCRTPRRTSSSR